MAIQTENAIAQLIRYGMDTVVVPLVDNVIQPAVQNAIDGYRNIGVWMESQATAYFGARISAVLKNACLGIPYSLALFVVPPWLTYGYIIYYTVVRVCTDWFDENGIKTWVEPIIGVYFLASSVAALGRSILQGGDVPLLISAGIQAFIGITFLPIH